MRDVPSVFIKFQLSNVKLATNPHGVENPADNVFSLLSTALSIVSRCLSQPSILIMILVFFLADRLQFSIISRRTLTPLMNTNRNQFYRFKGFRCNWWRCNSKYHCIFYLRSTVPTALGNFQLLQRLLTQVYAVSFYAVPRILKSLYGTELYLSAM